MDEQPRPPIARPRVEFTCVSCGYVLRGVQVDALCPECGTPVLNSVGANKPTSGAAVASMVLGILSILTCSAYGFPAVVLGPLALYFSAQAKRQLAAGTVAPGSRGMATAGFWTGLVGTILGGLIVAFVGLMFFGLILAGASGP